MRFSLTFFAFAVSLGLVSAAPCNPARQTTSLPLTATTWAKTMSKDVYKTFIAMRSDGLDCGGMVRLVFVVWFLLFGFCSGMFAL